MKATIERYSLWLLAMVFTVVAIVGLFTPRLLFDPTGLTLDTVAGLAEVRAAYFGLFGAVAYVFACGARDAARRKMAFLVATLVLGGFVLGRLISWGIDGAPTAPVAIINLIAETVGCVAAIALWRGCRGASKAA